MKRVFVDTNVFLRFFTRDDADHHKRAKSLFKKASAGENELLTGPPVLFEVFWTLTAGYKRDAQVALDVLESIVNHDGIILTDKRLAEAAIQKARDTGEDYADAYICVLAQSQKCDSVATFNIKHFKSLGADIEKKL